MSTVKLDSLIQFAITESKNLAAIPPLRHAAVEAFRADRKTSIGEFCDVFARRVAHQYETGKIDFETAGAAMNSIYRYILHRYDVTLPAYSLEVFLAFDEGEFRHREDTPDIDPEQKYTRAAITSIVVRDHVLGTEDDPSV